MLNMMCAIRIVLNPAAIFQFRKSVSSDAPITISGVVIGMKISRFVVAAAPEPVADERERDQRPERGREDRREERDLDADLERACGAREPNGFSQFSSVKPCQV